MKFTIQHVVYVIKQLVSPKMFANERLFTIQAFTITRVHCIWVNLQATKNLKLLRECYGTKVSLVLFFKTADVSYDKHFWFNLVQSTTSAFLQVA